MKKTIAFVLALVMSITILFVLSFPVFADSPEILVNPSFEEGIEGWVPMGKATLIEDDAIKPQDGEYSCHAADKYNEVDGPSQDITAQVAFYGKGVYRVSAYVMLDGTETSGDAILIIQTVSSDKDTTSAYPGQKWATTSVIKVNDQTWTKLEGEVDIQWKGELEFCNIYSKIIPAKVGSEPAYYDNFSMIKVGYTGKAFGENSSPTATAKPITTSTKAVIANPTVSPTPAIIPTEEPTLQPAITIVPSSKKYTVNPIVAGIIFGFAFLLIVAAVAVPLLFKKKAVTDIDNTGGRH